MGLQAVALLGLTGVLVVDVLRDAADDTTQALTEAGLVLVFALAAAALAKGLFAGTGWARTPALVWNLLLLPVSFSMFGAGQVALGTVVIVLAVLSLVMVWRSPALHYVGDDD